MWTPFAVPSWLFKVIKKIKAEKLLLLFHYCPLKGVGRSEWKAEHIIHSLKSSATTEREKKAKLYFLILFIFTSCYKELLTKILDCMCINNAKPRDLRNQSKQQQQQQQHEKRGEPSHDECQPGRLGSCATTSCRVASVY